MVFQGSLNTGESFKLLGRFAFNGMSFDALNENIISVSLDNPLAYENLVIAMYYDDWDTFSQYYDDQICVNKLSYASLLLCTTPTKEQCPTVPVASDGSSIIKYPPSWETSTYTTDSGQQMVHGESPFSFQSTGIKWFWFAIANCNMRACSGEFVLLPTCCCGLLSRSTHFGIYVLLFETCPTLFGK